MPDIELRDIIERAYQSRSREAQALARKIAIDWNQGITPALSSIRKLEKLMEFDQPCTRLQNDGRCGGWLRKYGAEYGIAAAREPYTCPYAGDKTRPSKFRDCPGFTNKE